MADRPHLLPPLPSLEPTNQSIRTIETSSTHTHEVYPRIPIANPATTAVLSPSQFELHVTTTHTTASTTESPTSTLTPSVKALVYHNTTVQSPEKRLRGETTIYHQSPSPNKPGPDFSLRTSDENSLHSGDGSAGWAEEERCMESFVAVQNTEEEYIAETEEVVPLPEVQEWELEATETEADKEEGAPVITTIKKGREEWFEENKTTSLTKVRLDSDFFAVRFNGQFHPTMPTVDTASYCQFCRYKFTNCLNPAQRQKSKWMYNHRASISRCLTCNVNLCWGCNLEWHGYDYDRLARMLTAKEKGDRWG